MGVSQGERGALFGYVPMTLTSLIVLYDDGEPICGVEPDFRR